MILGHCEGLADKTGVLGVLTRDIEIIDSSFKTFRSCSKAVKPYYGQGLKNELGFNEYEGDSLGITGKFVKEAAIFCGGKNGGDNLKTCFQYVGEKNE